MATEFHVTVEIGWALQLTDRKLTKMLTGAGGRKLTARELREHLIGCLREGYDYLPVCDNPKPDGMCAGHPVEEAEAE